MVAFVQQSTAEDQFLWPSALRGSKFNVLVALHFTWAGILTDGAFVGFEKSAGTGLGAVVITDMFCVGSRE